MRQTRRGYRNVSFLGDWEEDQALKKKKRKKEIKGENERRKGRIKSINNVSKEVI